MPALILVELGILLWALRAVRKEPRRASNAPLIGILVLALVGSLGMSYTHADPMSTGLMIVTISSPIWLSALIIALLTSGFKMLGRGARSVGGLVGGLTAVALIGVLLVGFWLIALGEVWSVALGLWLLMATSWFGFLFVSMVIYQWLYSAISARRPPDYVVVLGAGLHQGKVGRILANRVRRAVAIANDWRVRGHQPLLIMSGGQGDDEPRPEAAAMAEFATTELQVPANIVRQEDASTSTEENLRFSAQLVAADPELGPESLGLAVTSNFHVLRTADLARRLGLPIQVAGAPVVWYYWPAGLVREFVAQLVNHKWAVLISTIALTVPLPALLLMLS